MRTLPILVALMLISAPVHAGPKEACIASSTEGQEARDRRKLLRARDAFTACANEACPALIQRDCITWREDVEKRIPEIVVSARTKAGVDIVDAKLTVDGEVVASRLDGASVRVDPGARVLRVEANGYPSKEVRLVLREGEKNRLVDVVLTRPEDDTKPPPPPPPPVATDRPPAERQRSSLFLPIATTVLSVAGFGTFGFFYFSASSDVSHLRDSCSPRCTDDDVDPVRTKMIFAYVGLGVGVVAGTIATILWIDRASSSKSGSRPAGPVTVGAGSMRVSF